MRQPPASMAYREMPFVRMLVSFIGGILWQDSLGGDGRTAVVLMVLGVLLLFAYRQLPGRLMWTWNWWTGMSVNILLLAAGRLSLLAAETGLHPPPAAGIGTDTAMRVVELRSTPIRERKGWRAVTAAWRLSEADGSLRWEGVGVCHIETPDTVRRPNLGGRWLVRCSRSPLKGAVNPGGFDAAKWYGLQGLSWTLRIALDEGIRLPSTGGSLLGPMLEKARDAILGILRRYIPDAGAAGLAEALLIGHKADLDPSLSEAYAHTGVIHVIAISGLHIGIVFMILMALTSPLTRRKGGLRLQFLLVNPAIWMFSLLAGAGASVMRSACMFTLLGLSQAMPGSRSHPLNTLAATAFLLLAIRPHWLWDLGFQLSFAAVAGIMRYHAPLKALLPFENRGAGKLWETVAMTLSAQVLTLPLILLHFGRFPVFFLLTNLVAIPLSSLLLVAEILLCLLAFMPSLASPLGTAVNEGILWMNRYVRDMDSIPFGQLRDLHFDGWQTLAAYACILTSEAWWRKGGRLRLAAAVASALALSGLGMHAGKQTRKQRELAVPHLPEGRSVLLFEGATRTLLCDTNRRIPFRTERAIEGIDKAYRTTRRQRLHIPDTGWAAFEWMGRRILLLGAGCPKNPPQGAGRADIVILSYNTPAELEPWQHRTGCTHWVADGTNALWKIRRWEQEALRLTLPFHSTSRSGAFLRSAGRQGGTPPLPPDHRD